MGEGARTPIPTFPRKRGKGPKADNPRMPFAFLDADLDRSDDLRGDADALARLWSNAKLIAIDAEGHALSDGDSGPRLLIADKVENGFEHALLLGVRGDEAWFAIDAERVADAPEARTDLRSAAAAWPAFDASLFAQARAMRHWRARHRFCGVCGGENAFVRAGLVASTSEARRQIKGGGLRVNDASVTDEKTILSSRDLTPQGVVKLSLGRKRHVLLKPR